MTDLLTKIKKAIGGGTLRGSLEHLRQINSEAEEDIKQAKKSLDGKEQEWQLCMRKCAKSCTEEVKPEPPKAATGC